MCTAIPFISLSSAIYGYFIGIGKVYKTAIAQFIEQTSKYILIYLLISNTQIYNTSNICFILILGDLISEIISFIITYIIYLQDLKNYKFNYVQKKSDRFYLKRILTLASPIAITTLIRSILSSVKQFIIPISFSIGIYNYSQSLSIYGQINGMALPLITFPSIIFRSISNLLIPELSAFYTKMQFKKIKKTIKITLITSIVSSIFISIIFFLFAKQINYIIYKNVDITNYIKILAPVTIFILLDCVIDNILRGINKQNNVMFINILDLILTTLFIYLIVPKLGVTGYILSIYFSEILNIILSFKILKKELLLRF